MSITRWFMTRSLARKAGTRSAVRSKLHLTNLEDRTTPSRPLPYPVIFTATESGGAAVKAYDAETGAELFERQAFEGSFTGGVRVAAGDFTGDGYPDAVVTAGPGGGPRVSVLNGKTGRPVAGRLANFFAYDRDFRGGLSVAAADADGDQIPDIITAAGVGGGPHVRVFSGRDGHELASFYAYATDFQGGLSVAAADFTGDGRAEVAVGAGAGGGAHVRILSADSGKPIGGPLADFFAANPASRGGIFVGTDALAGDVNGDGRSDLVVGSGVGEESLVTVFDGTDGSVLHSFSPFDGGMTAGVRVGTAFVTDDAFADVVVGTGPGTRFRQHVLGTGGRAAGRRSTVRSQSRGWR